MRILENYRTDEQQEPFSDWMDSLTEHVQAQIYAYLFRVADGASKKNLKPVGDGVVEIKIDKGPGYRVYFGEVQNKIILLLLGGDKGTQARDILKAKEYWRDYREKNKKF